MKFKEWVAQKGLKLRDVADLLGCSVAYAGALCQQKKAPSLKMARKIEEATGYEVLVWDWDLTERGEKEARAEREEVAA